MKSIFVLSIVTIALIPPVLAHSWYPRECCNDKDCLPADSVKELPGGDAEVRVGNDVMIVPRSLKRRKSKDERFHVCYDRINGAVSVFCFFEPGLS